EIRQCPNIQAFTSKVRTHLNCSTKDSLNYMYAMIHDGKFGKLLTMIRTDSGDLNQLSFINHKTDNPFCPGCLTAPESSLHYFFICPNYIQLQKHFLLEI